MLKGGLNAMARNSRPKIVGHVGTSDGAQLTWEQPNQAKFINVNLNATDQEWLQAELPNHLVHINELLTYAGDNACRVSVVPDARSGRFNATITSYLPGSPRYGLILSVRAKSPTLALFALAYADGHKAGAWDTASDSSESLFG